MPHLDFFTEDSDIRRRMGPRRGERRGHRGEGGPETETSRLARQKRLTFRRIGAEGRIETIFPSLLQRGPVGGGEVEDPGPKGVNIPGTPPSSGKISPNIFKPASGETTQAKAARRAKSKRQVRSLEQTDPFSFLSSVSATAGSSGGLGGGSEGGSGSGGGGVRRGGGGGRR